MKLLCLHVSSIETSLSGIVNTELHVQVRATMEAKNVRFLQNMYTWSACNYPIRFKDLGFQEAISRNLVFFVSDKKPFDHWFFRALQIL